MAEAAVAATPKPAAPPAAPVTPPATPPATPPVTPPATPPAPEIPATPPAEPERKDGAPPEPPKPPERYDLVMPEGSRVDDEDRKQLEQMAKTAGWSNEDAQAALDELHAQLDAQATRWLTETKADRDYGGARLEESQRLATLAINRFRPEGHPRRASFLAFLNKGGAGNHLEVVAFLADLGTAMAEDSPALGKAAGPTTLSLAERLYPAHRTP